MKSTLHDLNKRIEEYSQELFVDLGPVAIAEEKKADLYARVEEHLHGVILDTLGPVLGPDDLNRIHDALEQEDYKELANILKHFPQHQQALDARIDEELKKLKLIIAEEENNATVGAQTEPPAN